MSVIRKFSLLVLGAPLLLAVAASAASATTVRSGSMSGPAYMGPFTALIVEGTTWDMASGFTNFSCDTAELDGDLPSPDGTGGTVSSASWTDSSDPSGESCPNNLGSTTTFTAANLSGWGVAVDYNGGSPTMTLDGFKLTMATPTVTGGFTCHYKGGGTGASVTGKLDNSAGTVTFNAVFLALDTSVSNSGWCSSTATWSGVDDVRGSGGARLYVTA
jgi:hypothetical protein